jgi:hypothetical protein
MHAQDDDDEIGGEPPEVVELPSLEDRLATLPRVLAGERLQLELPTSLIERRELIELLYADGPTPGNERIRRAASAALLMCWPKARRRPEAPRLEGPMWPWAGRVYDFLLGRGATELDILRAGDVAIALILGALTAQHSAQESARGNSEAPEGGTSESNAPLSVSGISRPVASAALSQKPRGW